MFTNNPVNTPLAPRNHPITVTVSIVWPQDAFIPLIWDYDITKMRANLTMVSAPRKWVAVAFKSMAMRGAKAISVNRFGTSFCFARLFGGSLRQFRCAQAAHAQVMRTAISVPGNSVATALNGAYTWFTHVEPLIQVRYGQNLRGVTSATQIRVT